MNNPILIIIDQFGNRAEYKNCGMIPNVGDYIVWNFSSPDPMVETRTFIPASNAYILHVK